MTASVRDASLAEMEAFYGLRCKHFIAEMDGQPLAMGTLTRVNGRLWGFLDRKDGLTKRQGMAVVWALIRGLKTFSEPIYVTCGEGIHPRASDLLRAAGFKPTGEVHQGFKIWVHQHG